VADPLERLTNLVALLLEAKRPMTLEQISVEFGGQYDGPSGRSRFERDKALLRAEGIPIDMSEDGDRPAYRIDRARYELGDLGLAPDERRALQLAVAAVHLDTTWGEHALLKLGDAPAADTAPVASVATLPALPVLLEAQQRRAPVSFAYREDARVLDVWGVASRDGRWYVTGFDHARSERRTFRVDRISGDVAVADPTGYEIPKGFDPRTAIPADSKMLGEGEVREAAVWIAARRAEAVVRELGTDAVWGDDGSVVVTVPVRNVVAFRSWVLGLLDDAEVLAPDDLRADLLSWLDAIAGAGTS
jgi:proteasome accessory factor B